MKRVDKAVLLGPAIGILKNVGCEDMQEKWGSGDSNLSLGRREGAGEGGVSGCSIGACNLNLGELGSGGCSGEVGQ